MDEQDRKLLLSMAQGMVRRSAKGQRVVSDGFYSEGSRGTSGNILLNTSPLILSGSSLGETLGWLASLSAQGTGSGGCTSLETIAKTSIVIVARRSCQSNTLRRLVPFRTVAAIPRAGQR